MSAGLLRLYWFYPAGLPQSGVVTGALICDFDDNTCDAAFDVDQGDLSVARALVESGLIVEVTHRSTRRLFALQDMAPLRGIVQPRAPAVSGRKRGRPRASAVEDAMNIEETGAVQDFVPIERWVPDYSELEAAIAEIDQLMEKTCL